MRKQTGCEITSNVNKKKNDSKEKLVFILMKNLFYDVVLFAIDDMK